MDLILTIDFLFNCKDLMHAFTRDEEPKDSSPRVEEQNADHYEMESKSNGSDDSFARNAGSPKSKDLGSTSHPGELQSRVCLAH